MTEPAPEAPQGRQPARRPAHERVVAHFDSAASYWSEVYDAATLEGVIYRERMAAVLWWVDGLGPGEPKRALDIGCGAGVTSVELARRGYAVDAIDTSPAMVERTRRLAREHGLESAIEAGVGDVHALPSSAGRFDLVVALGVIPWIEEPAPAVAEMARVVRPGGRVILSADNRARLNSLLDPLATPPLMHARKVQRWLRRRRRRPSGTPYRYHWPYSIDRLVARAGLERLEATTVGFGPFSLLGRPLVDDAVGLRLHRRLQALADRGTPGLRATGSHYLVYAAKPEPASLS